MGTQGWEGFFLSFSWKWPPSEVPKVPKALLSLLAPRGVPTFGVQSRQLGVNMFMRGHSGA